MCMIGTHIMDGNARLNCLCYYQYDISARITLQHDTRLLPQLCNASYSSYISLL